MHQVGQHHTRTLSSEGILGWPGTKSHSTEQLKNGALSSLSSASANITWAIVPSVAQDGQAVQPNTEGSSEASTL
ncbi:PREDICTED: oxysterol-binding protein-related protein 10-like [Buceros rhinoceros silvestris]|uniref:oxysterol-binding protein-related protein 10-like n=1 Tax=Buceros rhinoceros silvestris TaxID=175836 RepID=UPI000528AE4C|nr:PREDICTED: oxysterol-binding protein-related protein 10-like [Buceros rhinoceros silvestris]